MQIKYLIIFFLFIPITLGATIDYTFKPAIISTNVNIVTTPEANPETKGYLYIPISVSAIISAGGSPGVSRTLYYDVVRSGRNL